MNDAMELNHDLPLSAEQALAVQLGRAPLHLGLNLAGPLQASRLHEALLQVIQRHTSLRVALRPSTLYRSLRQSTVPASLDWHPLGAEQHADAQALAAQPQAVEQGCLVRAILRAQGAEQWRLDLYVAACAADRLSLQNLLGELAALYAQPDAALEEPFQYSQYVEWRNDLDADEEAPAGRAYWAGLGLETLAPVRLGGLREPAPQAPGNAVQQALPDALQAQLEHLAQRSEQSVGTVLQAAWWALLARIGGDARFIGGWQQDCRFEYEALANGIGVYEKSCPWPWRRSSISPSAPGCSNWPNSSTATPSSRSTGTSTTLRTPCSARSASPWCATPHPSPAAACTGRSMPCPAPMWASPWHCKPPSTRRSGYWP